MSGEVRRILEERHDYESVLYKKLNDQEFTALKKLLEGTTLRDTDTGKEIVIKKINTVKHTTGRYGSEYHMTFNGKKDLKWMAVEDATGRQGFDFYFR